MKTPSANPNWPKWMTRLFPARAGIGNQRGIALIGIVLGLMMLVAMFFASTMGMVDRAQTGRAVLRRQIFAQDVFYNAAVIIRDAYRMRAGLAVGTACPAGTIAVTLADGYATPHEFCFPAVTGPNPGGCIANMEIGTNPICLTTNNGQITMAPRNPENRFVAWVLDNIIERKASFSFGLPEAEAARNGMSNILPTLPAAVVHAVPNLPAVAQDRRSLCQGPANPTGGTGRPLVCVTIRVCMKTATCTDQEAIFQRIGFPPNS